MKYSEKECQFIMDTFKEYEKQFGEWLYTAWDFNAVDWPAFAEEAKKSIDANQPLTDKQKKRYRETFQDGAVY